MRLEDLQPHAAVRGILPDCLVSVVGVQWFGSEALELTYKDAAGRVANQLLYRHDEPRLEVVEHDRPWSFDSDGALFRLVSEAYRFRLAHLFDPVLAVHTSLIDPLPHQITAIYEAMLPRQPLRFLLADDPGAGKTIMAGLLIKELIARGDLRRCLIVCPGSLAEQWQDELHHRFHLPFEILTNDKLDAARTGNWFLENDLAIARLDQLSRNEDVQAKLSASDCRYDLIVCDEAHKLSATFFGGEVKYTKRYRLGQLLSGLTRHFLLMTATPHNEIKAAEEEILDQATAAATLAELRIEIETLGRLEALAAEVRRSGQDTKWRELAQLLGALFTPAGLGNRVAEPTVSYGPGPVPKPTPSPHQKLVVFTEHRDTLSYLEQRIGSLLGRPQAVVLIQGGMGREDRRKTQESFLHDPEVQVLLATDAAGEGINLQRAHLMVNYDLPWNPNRLEQRFGRIHRIGQNEVCHLWNLVAEETREGDVYRRLLEKLEEARQALGGQVFDVLGRLQFEGRPLRDLLIEAIRYGDEPEVRARLNRAIEHGVDRPHLQELIEERALAHDAMDGSRVARVREEMERAEARRLQPHYIESFFLEAFRRLGGTVRQREPRRYEITYVPAPVRSRDRQIGAGDPVLGRYERIAELDREAQLSALPSVVLGGLVVVPMGLLSAMTGRKLPAPASAADTQAAAARARAIVMEVERRLGFEPTDREFEKLGYDIESRVPKTGKLRFIEVKGRIAGADTITVTKNEILTSLNKPDDFILALVEFLDAESHRVHYVRQPFRREPDFGVTSVNYDFAELLARADPPL